ncbi:hypothetical protein ABMA70_00770 [Halobacteriovorax sp. XZX-3]|uniref:hypothetical protein n=1 Tax=unclassified Halobacteriovorax TaxID=2639665 RepID=UPI000CD02D76|nr:hypothetical protein [Halobacteriovorax sp. DA5]POB14298.1 hypothetical protein C0Z22_04200 [Halobacteriovorax sp. DA5]
MVDIHSIIATHKNKEVDSSKIDTNSYPIPTFSDIPEIFFDEILVNYRLTRVEIVVLMYLYRRVWAKTNPYREHGISQLMSLSEIVERLQISLEEIHQSILKLENFGFISTIRVGQYFVRRFFTKEYDEYYGQNYDDFEV